MKHQFFATCPKNIEYLLEAELQQLGAKNVKQTVAGVFFEGDLAVGYRACLWSRLANRILLPIKKISVTNAHDLYKNIQSIRWLDHFSVNESFVIDFIGQSDEIKNTQFGAQKVKDAIVDLFRNVVGSRPSVAKDQPDIRINVFLKQESAIVSLDLSGDSLHRRGYRQRGGLAPLKENLAAAILLRSTWPELSKNNYPLLDPLCGSATLLIEGAWIAADIAPGLLRNSFGFLKWRQHNENVWQTILEDANARRQQGLLKLKSIPIYGFDRDENAIEIATENIKLAGLSDYISVTKMELEQLENPLPELGHGLIVTNPPYGERMGAIQELEELYQLLGSKLKSQFAGWQAGIFSGNPDLCFKLKLRAHKQYMFFNADIPCKLLLFTVHPTVGMA